MMHAGKTDENEKNISRRKFVLSSGLLLGSLLPFKRDPFFTDISLAKRKITEKLLAVISTLPNFCTHEHLGSIDSIGQAPEQNGFRYDTIAGARPLRAPSVWNMFLDPFEEGWLKAGKKDAPVYNNIYAIPNHWRWRAIYFKTTQLDYIKQEN